MELIKCSDYVCDMEKSLEQIIKYARFLKQPLTLGMFIPIDLDGNVLEEPEEDFINPYYPNDCKQFKEAKDRVIFEGFVFSEEDNLYKKGDIGYTGLTRKDIPAVNLCITNYVKNKHGVLYFIRTKYGIREFDKWETRFEGKTIEDLTDLKLILTPNAQKQLTPTK